MPAAMARISANGVPAVAILIVGIWSAFLSLTGSFDILTDMYIFVLWVFFGLSGAAVIVLRHREPDVDRPYRVWGYPYVPAVFLLVTLYLLINTLFATPSRALAGIGLIVLGLPVYEYFVRRAGKVVPPAWRHDEEDNG
jgi:APA family basic amino acid/polyamine antiporter